MEAETFDGGSGDLCEEIRKSDGLSLKFHPRGNGLAVQETLNKYRCKNVNIIDLTDAEFGRNEFRHVCEGLVYHLLSENVKSILIRNSFLNQITNICRSKLLDCFNVSLGNSVTVCDLEIPLKLCINTDRFLAKLTGTDSRQVSPSVRKATQVLQNLNSIEKLPSKLVVALSRAHKYVKRRKKLEKRKRLEQIPFTAILKGDTGNTKTALKKFPIRPVPTPDNSNKTNADSTTQRSNENTQRGPVMTATPSQNVDNPNAEKDRVTSLSDLGCYICKSKYEIPPNPSPSHAQYRRLCAKCAEYNYMKRYQRTDLTGMVALVTGGRIKVGYEVALKLLRDGCKVYVTTRFPRDGAKRFSKEEDYESWCERLKVYPLDLKDVAGIYKFIAYLKEREDRLDIIINNAAQTIRRPIYFYKHLLPYETAPIENIPERERKLVHPKELSYSTILKTLQLGLPDAEANEPIVELAQLENEQITDIVPNVDDPIIHPSSNGSVIEKIPPDVDSEFEDMDCSSAIQTIEDVTDSKQCSVFDKPENQSNIDDSDFTSNSNELEEIAVIIEEDNEVFSQLRSAEHEKGINIDFNVTRSSLNESTVTEQVTTDKSDTLREENKNTHVSQTLADMFPEGMLDADGQQVDMRPTNSWRATIDDVPLEEMFEVMMINTIAPYIINKELKSLMQKGPSSRRFIVNVSAVEGQFHRNSKSQRHPHTNMTKAALNMMTRTAALGYKSSDIYMTSVDTGWVSDQNPYPMATYQRNVKQFETPLDYIDGASRIYDPIAMGLIKDLEPYYAVFLKNYTPHKW